MKIQQQPDYLIFADDAKTGEVQDFPNILRGWGVTIDQTQSKPPMEWMNGAFNRVDKNMLYLLQQGIPEWNSSVLYPIDAVIKYKSKLYIARAQNDNTIPSTNTTKWAKVVPDSVDASILQKGVVKLNDTTTSTSITEAATTNAVKVTMDKAMSAAEAATSAQTTANSSNTTANTAKTNAATAQTKADSAYALASTANTTANTAKSTVETDASTTVKGRVQLNSAVNSTVENQAATPKAVKLAYDLANTALSRSAGGTVTGNTNFSGKLQQAGSDVITVANIANYTSKTAILYPDGSESSPPILTVNQGIKIANPFNTMNVICYVEIFNNNVWGRVHDTFYNFDGKVTLTTGIMVTPLYDNQISITTGTTGLCTGGLAKWTTGNLTSAQYRVRVIKIGD